MQLIRVTLTDSTRLLLQNVQITGDTLRGIDARSHRAVSLALSNVERMQTKHVSAGKTVGLVLGLAAAAGAAVLIWIGSVIANSD